MSDYAPWKLIWHGNERYPFPLSILSEDGGTWIARDGTVSSEAYASLIVASPRLLAALKDARAVLNGEYPDWADHHQALFNQIELAIEQAEQSPSENVSDNG